MIIAAGAWAAELGRKAGGRPARYAPIERHLFITEAVPGLEEEHRRSAPDRRPVIGWDAVTPGLFWVAGLGGHGATGSAAVAERAAALVLERVG